MSDLLGIGASGVRAYQTALGVVGENIANAGTAGYVRRDAKLTESSVSYATNKLQIERRIFGGVDIGEVSRNWDTFKAAELRNASADVAQTESGVSWLGRVETALTAHTIGSKLTSFFNAARAMEADPASVAPRSDFLAQADSVATAFRGTADGLRQLSDDIVVDAKGSVATLNGLATSLAEVNKGLARVQQGTNAAASLRDERDRLLDQMATITQISVEETSSGVVNVRLNQTGGPLLVSGQDATPISVEGNASGQLVFTLDPYGAKQAIAPAGGALAGLVDAAARIKSASAELDQLATGFASAVNANQANGVDLDGNAGQPMFTTNYANAVAMPGTSGAATILVDVATDATPDADGYTALWSAANGEWTLSRVDGGASVSGTGTLTIDGVQVTLGGAPRDRDGFTITTGSGASGIRFTDLEPNGVAAASRWVADAPLANAGNAKAVVSVDPEAAGLPALPSYALSYADGNVSIANPTTGAVLATVPYVAGQPIEGAGFTITLSGVPAEGDSFTISATGADSRDNGNLVALAALRTTGGFETRFDTMVNSTANAIESRKALAEAQGAIRDNAVSARDSVSGVNLDNEAVELLKFQQAYQASSRLIQVARELFQTILDVA